MAQKRRQPMKIFTMFLTSLTVIVSLSAVVHALPITLNKTQFLTATSGLTTVVEDFETFGLGDLTSPVTLANSTYTSSKPQIRLNEANNPTKTLFENAPDPATGRVFSSFLPNTTLFGTDLNDLSSNSGVLDINVTGVSGLLNLQASFASLDSFFGVSDPLGLISVSFRNLGFENVGYAWGLDNVTTAAAPVPEPATMLLLGTGLAALAGARFRKKKR